MLQPQFVEIEMPDLGHIREEIDTLWAEVLSHREPYDGRSFSHTPNGLDITFMRA